MIGNKDSEIGGAVSNAGQQALKIDGPYQRARRLYLEAGNLRIANEALRIMKARENLLLGHPDPLRIVQQAAVAQRTGRRP